MIATVIHLKDIVIDPEKTIDLTSLPEAEAIELIKESYGFLSSSLDVLISDGIATISMRNEEEEKAEEALKWFQHALANAKQGNYKRAIQQFEKVLERLPNHVDARRNLAMAHLESGEKETAKNLLIQVLKLDPKDAWGYVLLGNIALKYENDLARAEKWYRKAFELNPKDAILLTNYGELMTKKGDREQAAEFMERAIEADPQHPNSYYGLALLHLQDEKPERSLVVLDDLFAKAKPIDVRSAPVFDDARRMYLEVNKQIADKSHAQLIQSIDERKRSLEMRVGGYPIEIVEDDSLDVSAVSQMAWKHGWDKHVIKYRNRARPVTPHLIAHELEHIGLEYGARSAGLNRTFLTTPKNLEQAILSIRDDIDKLKRQGLAEKKINDYVLSIVGGMARQLFNTPLDMLIEYRLFHDFEVMRQSQFASLWVIQAEGLNVFTNKESRRTAPNRIWKASVTLNCALAMLYDSLYQGKTEYARAYQSFEGFKTAQKLFGLWQEMIEDYQFGDEYTLVDEFAGVLKLEGWYGWQPDDGMPVRDERPLNREGENSGPQGSTNPELLKSKEPATAMYLMDTLKRFEKMTEDEIKRVGFETGITGMEGLDYASSDKKYTLKAFPGETFSGLQMMCFMYVAFKHIDPTLNTGLDFKEAYELAVKMLKS